LAWYQRLGYRWYQGRRYSLDAPDQDTTLLEWRDITRGVTMSVPTDLTGRVAVV